MQKSMCLANLGFWQDKAEPGKGNQRHAGEKIVRAKAKALQVSICHQGNGVWGTHLLQVGEGERHNQVERPVEACGHTHPSAPKPEWVDLRNIWAMARNLALPLGCKPTALDPPQLGRQRGKQVAPP